MARAVLSLIASLLALASIAGGAADAAPRVISAPSLATHEAALVRAVAATPAPPAIVAEVARALAAARLRFEARDAPGVLAYVSEQYRSGGLTKAGLREQLLATFALYEELRARVTIDRVEVVDGTVWVYTTGDVSGRLPMVGWMDVFAWKDQPEVARREAGGWRLFGFQD